MDSKLTEARDALSGAYKGLEEAVDALSNPAEDADIDALEQRCKDADVEVERRKSIVERLEKIEEARAHAPAVLVDAEERADIKVVREESTYRPDANVSFFRDLATQRSNPEAAERLLRHKRETESRDVSSASNGFIPPVYLSQYEVDVPRAGRPFANELPKAALPTTGTSFTIPRLATGAAVAAQTDGGNVQETDATTNTVTVYVRTIAGQQDISQQLLDRSDPAFDAVIFRDLLNAYDAELDRQCLHGSSGSNEHVGLENVSNINTVTYTEATPTAALTIPKIYDAIQKVASNRYMYPTHIVMHPRRAAALAAGLSTSAPLFQQGGLTQAVGEQNGGVVGTLAGLPVIVDANIETTQGTGTNQDEIFVVYMPDMVLMEGEVRTRVLDAPLSDTLEVRLQVFGYSALASERHPKSIAAITGTGLATPSF
jgi:HK97 family phage major capsid protein